MNRLAVVNSMLKGYHSRIFTVVVAICLISICRVMGTEMYICTLQVAIWNYATENSLYLAT